MLKVKHSISTLRKSEWEWATNQVKKYDWPVSRRNF